MQPKHIIREQADFIPSPGARPFADAPGGNVGRLYQQLDQHFGVQRPVDRVEIAISSVSRLSGPVIFVVALSSLVYWSFL